MITEEELKKVIRRLTGGYHDLIRLDFFHLKCKKCNAKFMCPYDWMDSTKISEWYEEIMNKRCQN